MVLCGGAEFIENVYGHPGCTECPWGSKQEVGIVGFEVLLPVVFMHIAVGVCGMVSLEDLVFDVESKQFDKRPVSMVPDSRMVIVLKKLELLEKYLATVVMENDNLTRSKRLCSSARRIGSRKISNKSWSLCWRRRNR